MIKNSSLKRYLLLMVFVLLGSCTHAPINKTEDRKISSESSDIKPSYDYPQIFFKVRETLRLDTESAKRPASSPPEVNLIGAIQQNQNLLQASKDELLRSIQQESTNQDPTKHLRLIPPAGKPGYSNLHYYADHPYTSGKKTMAASNLVEVWRQFLASAKKQIILNVFDFDLKIIAEQLIKKAKSGVTVMVGIDKNTIAQRPEVKAVYDMLIAGGVKVTAVNPVSLNHQKMAAIDWDDLDRARVLFSSGNLTQSCLGPEGDLINISADKRPPESVPNANHVLTMSSWLLANLVNHELTKTLDAQYLYRGSQYPTTGSFQVTGPGVDPYTLEAYPEHSVVISFSPGGGFKNINKNIIAHFVRNSAGPIRMMQFAYSSKEVSAALLERAQKDFQAKGEFDFKSVGDTPFALQYWSQFLIMSGVDLITMPDRKKIYQQLDSNPWVKGLTAEQLNKVRPRVRIAPSIYGNNKVRINGKSIDVTSKIHHKILATGPFAIVGTSFNFSEGAETNNEQILVFKEKSLVNFAHGMIDWMYDRSKNSVYEEVLRRNKTDTILPEVSPGAVEDAALEHNPAQLPTEPQVTEPAA